MKKGRTRAAISVDGLERAATKLVRLRARRARDGALDMHKALGGPKTRARQLLRIGLQANEHVLLPFPPVRRFKQTAADRAVPASPLGSGRPAFKLATKYLQEQGAHIALTELNLVEYICNYGTSLVAPNVRAPEVGHLRNSVGLRLRSMLCRTSLIRAFWQEADPPCVLPH